MTNDVGPHFSKFSSKYQESSLASQKLDEAINELKKINSDYTPFEENTDTLTELTRRLDDIDDKKIRLTRLPKERKEEGKLVLTQKKELLAAIKERFKILTSKKKEKKIDQQKTQRNVTKSLSSLGNSGNIISYNTLLEALQDIGFDFENDLETLVTIIDEKFVQALGKNQAHYQELLNELKTEYLNQQS